MRVESTFHAFKKYKFSNQYSKAKKKRSFFFRRLVTLTFSTTLFFSLITGLIFYVTSRNIMINEMIKQLQVSAKSISSILSLSRNLNLQPMQTTQFINNAGVQGTNAHIFNSEGVLTFYPTREEPLQRIVEDSSVSWYSPDAVQRLPGSLQRIVTHRQVLRQLLPQVLSGHAVAGTYNNYIVVGVPVTDAENPHLITDAVFISRQFSDAFELRDALYASLIVSMAIVALVMLIAVMIVSRRISRPVNNMRDIALSMAARNFHSYADERMDGEMGELARSLNVLSNELSKTIRALQLERNRLLSILAGLGEGILAVDTGGNITHVNPALEELFGEYRRGQSPEEFIPHPDLWLDIRLVIRSGDSAMRSLHLGDIILRVSITPLEEDSGAIAGAVALFRDVTESERLEQTRREYVANVSHELRTPVSSLQSLAETLQDGLIKNEADQQRYYGYMLRESQRLSRLINDLLELSRLQSGSVALKRSRIHMQELLMDVGERFRLLAQNNHLEFALINFEDCPDAYSNGDRADQILGILLDNAFKYTPEGGRVFLKARWDDERIYLSVIDSGSGIAAHDLPHLFERFYKADKAHSGHGTGLGLSIAYEVAQLLGESISVESEEGQGSTFTFTLLRYDVYKRLQEQA